VQRQQWLNSAAAACMRMQQALAFFESNPVHLRHVSRCEWASKLSR